MQPQEMQAGMVNLKGAYEVAKKYDFLSNKFCFRCGSSTHFVNNRTVAKGKTC